MSVGLSILLPTYNCADIVERTLRSIMWADEILVVDSYSNDETLAICQRYGARIIQHEYINSAKQKNWAVGQCTYEWVLQIDSDEILEEDAERIIRDIIRSASTVVHAFRLPRKNHILGEWVEHGGIYPDYQTRLFRRDEGRWVEREVHAHVVVKGEVRDLQTNILHYGMPHLSKQLRNLDRYTRYEADEARKQGKRFFWPNLFVKPIAIFLHRYIWLQGFRAGWRGFYLAAYVAGYTFWTEAKMWELDTLQLEKSPK